MHVCEVTRGRWEGSGCFLAQMYSGLFKFVSPYRRHLLAGLWKMLPVAVKVMVFNEHNQAQKQLMEATLSTRWALWFGEWMGPLSLLHRIQ